jgi:hypothetical protein
MNSIPTEPIALDTNIYALGIRGTPGFGKCSEFLYTFIPKVRLFLPLEVVTEIHRNFLPEEQETVYDILGSAIEVVRDYSSTDQTLVTHYEVRGAKKGDAVIAAQLHTAGIRWLISENRHFLNEISDLPFTVLTAAEALAVLEE